MRSAVVLFLMTAPLFLTACGDTVFLPECAWSAPIVFEEETIDWLGSIPWPSTAAGDFNEIGDHNELQRRYCPADN